MVELRAIFRSYSTRTPAAGKRTQPAALKPKIRSVAGRKTASEFSEKTSLCALPASSASSISSPSFIRKATA
eukprot:5903919-Pleurochrysis_carterae.AAC.7